MDLNTTVIEVGAGPGRYPSNERDHPPQPREPESAVAWLEEKLKDTEIKRPLMIENPCPRDENGAKILPTIPGKTG